MSNDLFEQAIGRKFPDIPVSWNKRDLLLYAIGVGAKKDDLSLTYELDKSWAPLPTYPVVLNLKGADHDVTLFAKKAKLEGISGLLDVDPGRMVHATQSIEVLKDIPPVSGSGWKLTKRTTGMHENKSGIILENEHLLLDPNGTSYAKLYSSVFYLGAKASGKKYSKTIAASYPAPSIPSRGADWVVPDQTTPEQAIIYRLSGDFNPMHIDPVPGQAAGFGGVILHGLSTYGFAARAVISAVGGGDPKSLRYFSARFTSPVVPGDTLETHIWETKSRSGDEVEVAFVTKNLRSGKVVLGNGVAYVKKASRNEKSKL